MSDILSQAEIDELLSSLAVGSDAPVQETPDDSARARDYDFKTANRFPKEQIRTFNVVFQSFSQLLSSRLSSVLRVSCECDVLSVEECSFTEFNNSLPTPVVLAVMAAPPMRGSLLFQISPEVAYILISRLFGGVTSGGSSKQFTEIELALLERVLRQIVGVFDEAWEKVLNVSAHIERIETSPQFSQVVAPNEPTAVIGINVRVGNESGIISICIPHTVIEPVSKQLNTRTWFAGNVVEDHTGGERAEFLSSKLIRTPVSLTALFDQTPATVSDIVSLQVGDVIRLNHALNQPITVKVHHIPKFHAVVGTMGSKYALQIVDIIKEENNNEPFTG